MTRKMNEPCPDTAPLVHECVLNFLENDKRGRVLDAGAGEGALTQHLLEMGFEVEACDLNPARFRLENKRCTKVDLNDPIQYANEYFDFIVCVETIEHLRNPWHTISEFARVLRRNGKLIVSTPNILNIASRLSYLLFGEYFWFELEQLGRERSEIYDQLDKHISALSFPLLKIILEENNLRVEGIAVNRYKPSFTKLPHVMYPLIKTAMRMRVRDPGILVSKELLMGEILVVEAKKL